MAPEDGGEESHRPPPHPLDRTWMHPSELGFVAGGHHSRRRWLPIVVAATVAGVAMATGVLVFAGFLADVGPARSELSGNNAIAATDALAATIVLVSVTAPPGLPAGSGVSIGDGQVVTSAHLVRDAVSATVTEPDGTAHDANVIGLDEESDVALLDVDASLPAAPLGRADLLPDDARLVAIAATGGADHWVRRARLLERHALARTDVGDAMFAGLLGTDAPTTPLHAGGALVDGEGKVVGILVTPPGTSMRGAALPIEMVTGVCDQLRRTGSADHGWIGIVGRDARFGVSVSAVVEAGPADEAGVRVGDLVVGVGTTDVAAIGELAAAVRERRPGDEVALRLVRDGRERSINVTLASVEPEIRATP